MKPTLKTDEQKISYALGLNFAMQVARFPVELDTPVFIEGIQDALSGTDKIGMSEDEFNAVISILQERMKKHHDGCHCETCDGSCGGEENKKAGDAYREENAKKQGVTVCASGLQIEHITEGTGKAPTASQTVRVHYTGALVDGTIFDSSVKRGQPIEFPLNRVIPGWTEGLQLMKEGGKAILTIPPELGYGEQGAGEAVPPMSTLIFTVELIKVL